MTEYYTNHLDRLPVEMIMYINDIIESNRRYELKQKMKIAGKYLEENFIRHFHKIYYEITEYKTKNNILVYYDLDEDDDEYTESICICYNSSSMVSIESDSFKRICHFYKCSNIKVV